MEINRLIPTNFLKCEILPENEYLRQTKKSYKINHIEL